MPHILSTQGDYRLQEQLLGYAQLLQCIRFTWDCAQMRAQSPCNCFASAPFCPKSNGSRSLAVRNPSCLCPNCANERLHAAYDLCVVRGRCYSSRIARASLSRTCLDFPSRGPVHNRCFEILISFRTYLLSQICLEPPVCSSMQSTAYG